MKDKKYEVMHESVTRTAGSECRIFSGGKSRLPNLIINPSSGTRRWRLNQCGTFPLANLDKLPETRQNSTDADARSHLFGSETRETRLNKINQEEELKKVQGESAEFHFEKAEPSSPVAARVAGNAGCDTVLKMSC